MLNWLHKQSSIERNSAPQREQTIAVLRLRGDISVSAPHIQDLLNIFPQMSTENHAALIITLETAGGTLTCAENVMGWVEHLYRPSQCPVIAVIEERCLSAGLAVAAHCDRVFAQPSAMLGAFGVTMVWPGAQKLRTQLGLLSRIYKTTPLKDFASPYREPDATDDAAIMDVLRDVHEQFGELLRSKRKLSAAEFDEIADGRLITGRRALELGLVDELGGLETGINWLRSRQIVFGDPPYTLVFLGDPRPASGSTSANPLDFLKTLLQPT